MEDIDLGDSSKNAAETDYSGMTKEELLKYSNDPFWVRLRWAMVTLFWVLWVSMLFTAVMIILGAPKCRKPEPKSWWEEGPLMEISDINIEESQLTDLHKNGIKGFIVAYPEDTFINFSIKFLHFLKITNKNKLNVIVELIPGVSDLWFNKSEARDEEYEDYYIWYPNENSFERDLPNNWLAKESNDETKVSAWKYSVNRNQFYYVFDSKPQLNFRTNKVVKQFSDVLLNFLQAGVKGIRLRDAPYLLVDAEFTDEDVALDQTDFTEFASSNYDFYEHTRTKNIEGLRFLLKQWRDLLKNQTNNGVFMLSDDLRNLKEYIIEDKFIVDLPKTSEVFNEITTGIKLKNQLNLVSEKFKNAWPLWDVNNAIFPLDVLYPIVYLLKGCTLLNSNNILTHNLKHIRKSPSIIFGSQELFTVANNTIFAYIRIYSDNPGYIVALNPSDDSVMVDFPAEIPQVSNEVNFRYGSKNYNGFSLGGKMDAHKFELLPKSSVVLSYVPKKDSSKI